ncbi:MAG TPA: PQQ-binding-like beta-propeller repeat protein [Gemmatales bacterium]|nr:PQQ-binding-like beta-propeller repeat protein [Gemmatales bacterium]
MRPTLIISALFLLTVSSLRADDPVTHRVLAADRETGRLAIIGTDGKVEWEIPNKHDVHDLHMLDNGNILTHTSHTTIVEISPNKEIVWKYEAKPKPGYTGKIEIHAFQRLPDGNTMIAESGNSRIIEVNREGKTVKEIALNVKSPSAHRDTRMVRALSNGHYLVCHEGEGCVKEYDGSGKVVWEYALDLAGRPRSNGHGPEGHGLEVYGAVRLPNGNTLIAGGNNNRVIEVKKKKKIVWQVDQKDLPGITLAWVTTLQVLPNGNLVIGNCHAGPQNPQLIEVTRDKKVIWTFKDHKLFGNSLASAVVLDIKGNVIR